MLTLIRELQPVPFGVPLRRAELSGDLFLEANPRWAVVRGGPGPSRSFGGELPLFGTAREVVEQLLVDVDDPVVADLRKGRAPRERRVLLDRLEEVAPRRAAAIRALERRWLDPMQTSWIPPIRSFTVQGEPIWGARCDLAFAQFAVHRPDLRSHPVPTWPRADDVLVEAVLRGLGITDIGYYLVDSGFSMDEAVALHRSLQSHRQVPEGSLDEVLTRLRGQPLSGGEEGTEWRAWLETLSVHERRTARSALLGSWGDGATSLLEAILRRVLGALQDALQRSGLWCAPPHVGPGAVSAWEDRHAVALPGVVQWFFKRVSSTTGIDIHEQGMPPIEHAAIWRTPVRRNELVVLEQSANQRWLVAEDGLLHQWNGRLATTEPWTWLAHAFFSGLLLDGLEHTWN
ncbi:MAG: hypothetical protein AAGA48_14390 [Myxococcota bacterium]